ncbi:MAG: GWxTD domain-containing protein [Candidatus Krumholzibacteria bacterium]|nr:GWxTD domain-containing protein [Candidatus Krumholzibacteria bacterium]
MHLRKWTLLTALVLLPGLFSALHAESLSAIAGGDLPFRLWTYSFPHSPDSSRLLLLASIPARRLHWQESDSLRTELQFSFEFHEGGELHRNSTHNQVMVRSLSDSRREEQLLVTEEWILPPGDYRLEFTVEEKGARLGGLPGGWFARHPRGELSARIRVRDFSSGGLSDPLLMTEDSSANPWASYAAGEGSLELYSEFQPPPTAGKGWLSLRLLVEDRLGLLRLERKGAWQHKGEVLPLRLRLPLDSLETGSYRLRILSGGDAGGEEERVFHVLEPGLPGEERERREKIEAELLLDADDILRWSLQPSALKSEELRRLWENAPGQRKEFRRRYREVESRFGGSEGGALSDRGRVWLRLGPPDEIQVEAMPENREALERALRKLHGMPDTGDFRPRSRSGEFDSPGDMKLDRDLGKIGMGGLGSLGSESEAFEVWTYRIGGRTLFPGQAIGRRESALTLIFLDREGTGNYLLSFSSEDLGF